MGSDAGQDLESSTGSHSAAPGLLAPFQESALAFFDATGGRVIYGDPMGARKTGTSLSWCAANSYRILVVAPRSVHGHWLREAARFAPKHEARLATGTKAKRAGVYAWASAEWDRHSPPIVVTTYESMKMDESLILASKFDTLIFDEAHRLKGRRTDVALCSNAVTKRPEHLFLLTGTPVLNGAEELWQYLHMLKPSVYRSFWAWAEEHFVIEIRMFRGNRFPTKLIHGFKPGHEHRVRQQLHDCLIQRTYEELFPGEAWIAEPEHVVLPVQLSSKERKAYDQLVKHQWTNIDGLVIETDNKLALSTRLQQLTSEWGSIDAEHDLEDGTKVVTTAERARDILESENNLVIFTKFQETANRIVRRLRASSVSAQPWHGGVDMHLREEALRDFGAGKLQVIVGTIASLGEGVDGLQYGGSTIIMVDRDWTSVRNDQAIGRRRRSGQSHRVRVEHVMAENTIDDIVVEACIRKANVIELLAGRPLRDAIYGTLPLDLGDA